MIDRTSPPPVKTIDTIQLLPLHYLKFSNDFEVYYISSKSEIIQLTFFFKAGYIHQFKKLLTNAFTSLITSGTLMHSSREIAETLEYYGVFYAIEPTTTHTKLQFTFLKKNLDAILPIIEEIIKYAHFPEEELNLYIKNQTEQYQTQIKNVNTLAQWNYSKILYGNEHPLNKLHTPSDYQNITRNDLLYFFTTHIHPKNGFIFISGDIDNAILQSIANSFGNRDFNQTQHIFTTNVPFPQSIDDHIYIQIPDALQSAIRVGMDIPLTHKSPDYFDFTIANTLLGGFFGSRLMRVIREEKGYTYGIHSSLTTHDLYSVFTIASEVKAEHTQACLDELFQQIELLQNNPPDAEEVLVLKNFLSGEILDLTDGLLKQDNMWKAIITRNLEEDYYNRFLQRLQTIQAEDISHALKKYISIDKFKKCIVGKI